MGIQRSKKTKIYPDNVALGRDTTGNYVASASASTGINISGSPSENSQLTISNTGVTSLTGTANEVELSASAGAVQVGLPNEVRIESLSSGTASVDVSSQENIFVSIRSNSTVAQTSTDGIAWTLRTIMPSIQSWRAATYVNNTFVAVAYGSAAAATSTDGITWTAGTLPSSQFWGSVAYGNNTFVAVAYYSAAASSTDGITWTARTMPSSQYWNSVTYGDNKFVAVAEYSTLAASSTDGITWTARTMPSSQAWTSITYGNNTFVVVAGFFGSSTAAASSTDGITWTARTMPSALFLGSVTYGNNVFVAVGPKSGSIGNNAVYSTDGITWTITTLPLNTNWQSVIYGNNAFVAIGTTGAASSTDGITWTQRTNAVTGSKYALAYGTPTVLTPTPIASNLVPTQTGNSGKYLTTDGNSTFWSEVSGSSSGVTSLSGTLNEIEISASVGNITLSLPSTINANTTGSAATLTTPRSIGLSGDVSGSANFDGSSNITITATVADDSHNHIISNVDGLQTALDAKLDSTSYTASDVLTKIKTVDGSTSGLDSDLLDGQEGSYYLDWTNTTNKPDPTITLGGDASGSLTLTDLAGGTLTVTIADDSHNHIISNVDGLQTALDAKAPLESPALTGTPTAPTASASANSTQIATTAFVQTNISNLINGAPGALDTLDELAAALGDDANFASTVTNSLAGKQPIDADLTAIAGLSASATGFLKKDGDNSWSLDGNTYLTGNQTITLSGDVSGSGTTEITVTVADDSHNHIISNVDGLQTALDGKQTLDADLTAIAALSGTSGFLKKTAADTWSLDTNTYLTGNQSISISGDATGSGTTSISLTLANSGVSANSYGSASAVPTFTVDAKGRLTSASNTAIVIAQSAVTNLTSDLATKANLASPTFTGTVTVPTLSLTTADTATAATHYMVETSTDGIVRPKTLANVRTEIVTNDAVNAAFSPFLLGGM